MYIIDPNLVITVPADVLTVVGHDQQAQWWLQSYRQVSNISPTLAGYKIVNHSNVVGASPVGAAPTTSSFST